MIKKLIFLSLAIVALNIGCSKNNKNRSNCKSSKSCFVCVDCKGQYAHLINGQEKCVDGYDNCEDWEQAKINYETNDDCNCEFTQ